MEDAAPLPFFNAYQPSPDVVRVIWNNLKDQAITASVIDMSGRIITTQEVQTADTQADFDVSNLATGVYVINLVGKNTNLSQKVHLGI